MNKLATAQREKVEQIVLITGCSDKAAIKALKNSEWEVEQAFDYFYNQSDIEPTIDSALLDVLYDRYKDPQADMIMADGITHLCDDLEVDPQDIVMLVISWHFEAATMCEFSKDEFIDGMKSLGVDTTEKFREKIPQLRSELKDEQKFSQIYNFAFDWAKKKGHKSLVLDTAVGMWQLLFAEKHWPLIDLWCQFVQAMHKKAISRDTWTQLLDFVDTVEPDVSNFDPDGAWPYLIDEFVEYLNDNGMVRGLSDMYEEHQVAA